MRPLAKYSKGKIPKQAILPWTTRLKYPGKEVHAALFEAPHWSATRLFSLDITGRHIYVTGIEDGNIITTHFNGDLECWVEAVCQLASDNLVAIYCRTSDELEIAARRIAKLLPNHNRVALERMSSSVHARSGLS